MFRAGQTFLFPINDPFRTRHLWIIATNPCPEIDSFAVVSCTTLRGAKDQTVTLTRGDHPFLKWDTCLAYALAEVISVDALQRRLDEGSAEMNADLKPDLLKLVVSGFGASDFTKNRVRDYVKLQRSRS